MQGRRQKGKSRAQGRMGLSCGDSARLQCEFSKTFFKLSTSAGLLRRRRGRGAGPQRSSGVLGSARGEPGGFPAPPPSNARDRGSGDQFEEGEARATEAFPESRATSGFLLTCPQLPGPLTIYLTPSHRPSGRPTCKTERHRNYPRGRAVGQGLAGFLSFSNFPPPFLFLSSGFVRVSPGFTLLHRHFVCKAPHAPDTVPRPGPHRGGRKEKVGVRGAELGGGSRLPWHSVQRGGGGGWGSPAEALCKLNKSSELPCRSGLSRRGV